MSELLSSPERNASLRATHNSVLLDYSRQRVTPNTMSLLSSLAKEASLNSKIQDFYQGSLINNTEKRAVLHHALRAPKTSKFTVGSSTKNVVDDVHEVLDKIYSFSRSIRDGSIKGVTGEKLTSVVSIGIGGSYLGPEFVYEALKCDEASSKAAQGI